MKHFLIISIMCYIIGYYLFSSTVNVSKQVRNNENGIPSVVESEDDPLARAEQEFLMLRDPFSNKIPSNIYYLEREFAKNLPKQIKHGLSKNSGKDEVNTLTWTARGPNNVGGRTRALGIDVRTSTQPNITILAGGVSGGIWRSTNNGSSWTSVTSPNQLHSVTCITQDNRSGHKDTWYAGTGEALGNSASGGGGSYYRGDGVFKSTDNGLTWSIIASTATNKPQSFDQAFDYIYRVEVDQSNTLQDEIYVAASNTIQRSSDGGTTWTTVLGTFSGSFASDVQVSTTGVVYAAISSGNTNSGIWRSTDGISWTSISSGVSGFPTSFGRIVIGIAPPNENIVYFLIEGTNSSPNTNTHQLWKYTFLSGDGSGTGGSWVNRGGNLPDEPGGSAGNDPFDTQGGYDMMVKVSPSNADVVVIGGTNLYISTDGFSTTSNYNRIGGYATPSSYAQYTNHHPDQHSGSFLPGSDLVFYSGDDGGIQKTDDVTATTVSWTPLNTGYLTTQFYSVSLDPESASNVMMGGAQDNGTWYGSSPGLSNWTNVESGDGTIVEVAPLADDLIYTAYQNGGIRRRRRSGLFLGDFTPSTAFHQLFVNPLVLDPNNSTIMYYGAGTSTTNTRVWRCNPKTASASGWTNLSATNVNSDQISALGISTANLSNVLYMGTKNGIVKRVDNANTSPTVTDVSSGLPSNGYVSCVAVDPTNSNNAIVVFSNYNFSSLWYTTNGGSNWTDVEGNLSGTNGPSIRWATIFYVSGTPHYFLGTSVGVYFTITLNGSSTVWTQEAVNTIGNTVVTMLDWRDNDGTLAAATHGMGIFTTQITSPLPVELSSFSARFIDNSVKLVWKTETEVNNYGFEVERKVVNSESLEVEWVKIGFVEGSGNSNSPKNYDFEDNNISSGKYAYRLKQIDNDGSFEYSGIVEVYIPLLPEYAILEQNYPNPFNPSTKIKFMVNENIAATLKIFSSIGEEIETLYDGVLESGKFYNLNFNAVNLPSGVYYYRLSTPKQSIVKKMLLIK